MELPKNADGQALAVAISSPPVRRYKYKWILDAFADVQPGEALKISYPDTNSANAAIAGVKIAMKTLWSDDFADTIRFRTQKEEKNNPENQKADVFIWIE